LGTVFQLTPGTPWIENKLHDFQNADDGAVPYAGLIADSSGNFYGAAPKAVAMAAALSLSCHFKR